MSGTKEDIICSYCGRSRNKDIRNGKQKKHYFTTKEGRSIPDNVNKELLPYWKEDTDKIKYKLCHSCYTTVSRKYQKYNNLKNCLNLLLLI